MQHRLFIAVDLPDAVRRRLARIVADAPAGVRPVRVEQIHLTLHFLGAADDAALAGLAAGLMGIRRPAFVIDLVGAGVFPLRGRPAVLWAGVAETADLRGLHGDVAGILTACGLAPDPRPWIPHVTLARLGPRVPRDWTTTILDRRRSLAERTLPVTAVRLYESLRTAEGPVHAPVATVALAVDRPGAPRDGAGG